MTPPNQAMQEAVRRIMAVEASGSGVLDLALPLSELPNEITRLKGLRVLILGNGEFDEAQQRVRLVPKRDFELRPLAMLRGLDELETLEHLDLSGLTLLSSLKELANLGSLRSLNLCRCTQLTSVADLGKLPSLTALHVGGCTGLTSVAELEKLASLTTLSLSGCAWLTSDAELGKLASLTTLSLSGCASLDLWGHWGRNPLGLPAHIHIHLWTGDRRFSRVSSLGQPLMLRSSRGHSYERQFPPVLGM
jgi:hypothetical protein